MNNKNIIHFEYCNNCRGHGQNAHNDEAKYFDTFIKLRDAILEEFKENLPLIISNQPRQHLVPIKPQQSKYFNSKTRKYVFFPSIGSFQITLNDVLIFSKKQTNTWPSIDEILDCLSLQLLNKQRSNKKRSQSIESCSQTTKAFKKSKQFFESGLLQQKKANIDETNKEQKSTPIEFKTIYSEKEQVSKLLQASFPSTPNQKRKISVQLRSGRPIPSAKQVKMTYHMKENYQNPQFDSRTTIKRTPQRKNSKKYGYSSSGQFLDSSIVLSAEEFSRLKKVLARSQQGQSQRGESIKAQNQKQILVDLCAIQEEDLQNRQIKNILQNFKIVSQNQKSGKSLSKQNFEDWGVDLLKLEKYLKLIEDRVKAGNSLQDQSHSVLVQNNLHPNELDLFDTSKAAKRRSSIDNEVHILDQNRAAKKVNHIKNQFVYSRLNESKQIQANRDSSDKKESALTSKANFLERQCKKGNNQRSLCEQYTIPSDRYDQRYISPSHWEEKGLSQSRHNKFKEIEDYIQADSDQKTRKLRKIYGNWKYSSNHRALFHYKATLPERQETKKDAERFRSNRNQDSFSPETISDSNSYRHWQTNKARSKRISRKANNFTRTAHQSSTFTSKKSFPNLNGIYEKSTKQNSKLRNRCNQSLSAKYTQSQPHKIKAVSEQVKQPVNTAYHNEDMMHSAILNSSYKVDSISITSNQTTHQNNVNGLNRFTFEKAKQKYQNTGPQGYQKGFRRDKAQLISKQAIAAERDRIREKKLVLGSNQGQRLGSVHHKKISAENPSQRQQYKQLSSAKVNAKNFNQMYKDQLSRNAVFKNSNIKQNQDQVSRKMSNKGNYLKRYQKNQIDKKIFVENDRQIKCSNLINSKKNCLKKTGQAQQQHYFSLQKKSGSSPQSRRRLQNWISHQSKGDAQKVQQSQQNYQNMSFGAVSQKEGQNQQNIYKKMSGKGQSCKNECLNEEKSFKSIQEIQLNLNADMQAHSRFIEQAMALPEDVKGQANLNGSETVRNSSFNQNGNDLVEVNRSRIRNKKNQVIQTVSQERQKESLHQIESFDSKKHCQLKKGERLQYSPYQMNILICNHRGTQYSIPKTPPKSQKSIYSSTYRVLPQSKRSRVSSQFQLFPQSKCFRAQSQTSQLDQLKKLKANTTVNQGIKQSDKLSPRSKIGQLKNQPKDITSKSKMKEQLNQQKGWSSRSSCNQKISQQKEQKTKRLYSSHKEKEIGQLQISTGHLSGSEVFVSKDSSVSQSHLKNVDSIDKDREISHSGNSKYQMQNSGSDRNSQDSFLQTKSKECQKSTKDSVKMQIPLTPNQKVSRQLSQSKRSRFHPSEQQIQQAAAEQQQQLQCSSAQSNQQKGKIDTGISYQQQKNKSSSKSESDQQQKSKFSSKNKSLRLKNKKSQQKSIYELNLRLNQKEGISQKFNDDEGEHKDSSEPQRQKDREGEYWDKEEEGEYRSLSQGRHLNRRQKNQIQSTLKKHRLDQNIRHIKTWRSSSMMQRDQIYNGRLHSKEYKPYNSFSSPNKMKTKEPQDQKKQKNSYRLLNQTKTHQNRMNKTSPQISLARDRQTGSTKDRQTGSIKDRQTSPARDRKVNSQNQKKNKDDSRQVKVTKSIGSKEKDIQIRKKENPIQQEKSISKCRHASASRFGSALDQLSEMSKQYSEQEIRQLSNQLSKKQLNQDLNQNKFSSKKQTKSGSSRKQRKSASLRQEQQNCSSTQENVSILRIPAEIRKTLYSMTNEVEEQKLIYEELIRDEIVFVDRKKTHQGIQQQCKISEHKQKFAYKQLQEMFPNGVRLFGQESIQVEKVTSGVEGLSSAKLIEVLRILASVNELLLVRLFEDYKIVQLSKQPVITSQTSDQSTSNFKDKHRGRIKRAYYGVWLCIKHQWRCVVVNNVVPITYCRAQSPADSLQSPKQAQLPFYPTSVFASHSGYQAWPCILQKAIVVGLGSYSQMAVLQQGDIFQLLTGSNFLQYNISENESKNRHLYKAIAQAQKKNFIISCQQSPSCLRQKKEMDEHPRAHLIVSSRSVLNNESNSENLDNLAKPASTTLLFKIQQLPSISQNENYYMKQQDLRKSFHSCTILHLKQYHNYCRLPLGDDNKNSKDSEGGSGKQAAERWQQTGDETRKCNNKFTVVELTFDSVCKGTVSVYNERKGRLRAYLYKVKNSDRQVMKLVGEASKSNHTQIFFDCYFQEHIYYLFLQSQHQHPVLSYMGQGKPRLLVKEHIREAGLRNQNIEYLPVDRLGQESSQIQSPQKLKDSAFHSVMNKSASMDDLREMFVNLILQQKSPGRLVSKPSEF